MHFFGTGGKVPLAVRLFCGNQDSFKMGACHATPEPQEIVFMSPFSQTQPTASSLLDTFKIEVAAMRNLPNWHLNVFSSDTMEICVATAKIIIKEIANSTTVQHIDLTGEGTNILRKY